MKNTLYYSGSLFAVLLFSLLLTGCQKENPIDLLQDKITGENQIGSIAKFAQASDYDLLTDKEKADLSRFLGMIWADGRPTDSGTGAKYSSNHSKYNGVVNRLAAIKIGGNTNPFNFPTSGNLKLLPNIWDYWDNSLPGGNPNDPQLLREAIRNPNFLAGLIEGEGQVHHKAGNRYYIDDHTFTPSHPDKKSYGQLNFGPERMNQLFLLLGETYGFVNTEMEIGKNGTRYNYATERCEALQAARDKYQEIKANNEDPTTAPKGVTIKIYIDQADFVTLRSYGYYQRDKFRTPAPDNDGTLNVLQSNLPDILPKVQGPMSFFEGGATGFKIAHTVSDSYLNSDLDLVPFVNDNTISWELIDLGTGYFRIISLDDSKDKRWLKAWENGPISLVGQNSTGHKTQWEQIELSNGSYLLKNRFFAKYLRLGTNGSVKHGASGMPAHWSVEEVPTCTP